jgi:hypothetical protein
VQPDVRAEVDRAHPAGREQPLDPVLVVEHRALRQLASCGRVLHLATGYARNRANSREHSPARVSGEHFCGRPRLPRGRRGNPRVSAVTARPGARPMRDRRERGCARREPTNPRSARSTRARLSTNPSPLRMITPLHRSLPVALRRGADTTASER